MSSRPTDLAEIIARLQADPMAVARRYAPGGAVANGQYTVRCPWRDDRKAGSFILTVTGKHAGRWHDFASNENGDMLDLIQRVVGGDKRAAIHEAMGYLGITEETPEQRSAAVRRALEARERMAAEERPEAADAAKIAYAHRVFQHSQTDLKGTPVDLYLRGRGINLGKLGRIASIRFHPGLKYLDTDPETGLRTEAFFPAMVTAILGPADVSPPAFLGTHRTYLAKDEAGVWRKAPVRAPKKVLGGFKGGFIRLWTPPGSGDSVFITEGVEDGLSAAILDPSLCVLVAVSVGNFAGLVLPPAVRAVTIAADNDDDKPARKALEKALIVHKRARRQVAVWRNTTGGKDLNDALRAALEIDPPEINQ